MLVSKNEPFCTNKSIKRLPIKTCQKVDLNIGKSQQFNGYC